MLAKIMVYVENGTMKRGNFLKHNKNRVLRGNNMFYGTLYNPCGLTAEELLKYLEHVIAHWDGGSKVYASTRLVTMISCEPNCVLMETIDYK